MKRMMFLLSRYGTVCVCCCVCVCVCVCVWCVCVCVCVCVCESLPSVYKYCVISQSGYHVLYVRE